ncbi:MAG: DNA-3-methyladenine glycosylase 2 family protein, partial [Planctomycetes bacterium]|nr:DNA-3-methyladenine glycosylase 2 family protein [Planctomycetota bacterium]
EGVVLDADHAAGMEHVFAVDPEIRRLARRHGPFSPTSHYRDDAYDALFEAIIFQQLSTKAARTIAGRVHALSRGDGYARPTALARIPDEKLRAAGLSHQKISYVRSLAEHTASGELPFRRFARMGDDEIVDVLTQVRGFGRWSAEMFLMFHLGRLDVFPIGDLGVRKGLTKVYGVGDGDRTAMERIADRWRPYRSIGSWYMWRALEVD